MTNQMVGIEINDLHLSFGDTEVLTGVNLDIQPGEFFAFLGPSGSGKSTLLRSIAGFGPTPRGSIRIGGRDVVSLPPWKRNVGMVFQSYALWPHMSVRDNVGFGLKERKVPSTEIAPRVDAALELVGLSHLADRMPNQLSGGQQQRAAIARALCMEPEALLFDEPTSALDPELEQEVVKVIKDLAAEGRTMVIVTHDMKLAADVSDHVVFLHKGLIEEQGTPEELFGAPKSERLRGFLSATQPA